VNPGMFSLIFKPEYIINVSQIAVAEFATAGHGWRVQRVSPFPG
jgi:hypothetical protein